MACMNNMPHDMQSQVKETSLKMQLSLIDAALKQGNQDFAKKYISSIKSKVSYVKHSAYNPVSIVIFIQELCLAFAGGFV